MQLDAKSRVATGTVLGLLYLLVEGGGIILLTKYFSLNFKTDVAGVFTVIIYALALSNLLITSLGPAIVRAVASADSDERALRLNIISGRIVAKYCWGLLVAVYLLFAIIKNTENINNIFFEAWLFFSLGHLCRLIGLYFCFELVGFGKIGVDRLYQLAFSFVFTFSAICVLWMGYGIIVVSWVYFSLGMLLLFVVIFWGKERLNLYSKPKNIEQCNQEKYSEAQDVALRNSRVKILGFEAAALLLNNATGFIIMNGDVFVVQFLFGVKVVAEYSLYSRLAALIVAVGGLASSMYFPLIARAWAKQDVQECRRYRLGGVNFAIFVFFTSSVFSLLIYRRIIAWTFSGDMHLPEWIIYLSLAYAAISLHTVVNGMPILATGRDNLVRISFVNAVCVIAFSIVGGSLLGLPGVPIGAILASILPTIFYKKRSYALFHK